MSTLLLDADGVFVDFVKGFLGLIQQVTGKTFTADQITDFDICKSLGLTAEEKSSVFARIRPGFCLELDPIPGAVEAIQKLANDHDIVIVTSPLKALKTWASERETWIAQRLGKFPIISTSEKFRVRGDFLVDDRDQNVWKWTANNSGYGVIWESPWNAQGPTHGCHRFNEWDKLEKLVKDGFV